MLSKQQVKVILESDTLLERLASVEHERWAHWQQYLHDQCERAEDGSLVIPASLVQRWTRQIATQYADLTDKEKQSDRDQVHRYLSIIADAIEIVAP